MDEVAMDAVQLIERPPVSEPAKSELHRNLSFYALWACAIANGLGEKVFFVALVLLATKANHANSLVSAVSIALAVPAVLFGSVAGVFVDRFPLRWTLFSASFLRMALVLALPLAGGNLGLLLAFAFGFGLITQFHNPTFTAAIPAIIRREQLMAANAFFTMTMIATLITGFALAGPLSRLTGLPRMHLVVGLIFLLGALSVLFVRFPPFAKRKEEVFLAQWRSTWTYLQTKRYLLVGMSQVMILFGTFAALNVLAIGFARDVLHLSDFGIIIAAAGVGMALGAMVMGRFGACFPKQRWIFHGFLLAGSSLVLLALSHSLPLVLLFAMLTGVAGAMIDVPVTTLLQEGVDEDMRGKVFGLQSTLMNLASTLPMAFAGPLADLWGTTAVMIALGLSLVAFSFLRSMKEPS
jgi:MFS family permease